MCLWAEAHGTEAGEVLVALPTLSLMDQENRPRRVSSQLKMEPFLLELSSRAFDGYLDFLSLQTWLLQLTPAQVFKVLLSEMSFFFWWSLFGTKNQKEHVVGSTCSVPGSHRAALLPALIRTRQSLTSGAS